MSEIQKKRVPVILSDVDGVLKQGFNTPINDKIVKGLKIARSSLGFIDPNKYGSDDNQKIPFFLLTNRGGMTEKDHQDLMNKAMNFNSEENKQYAFKEFENILNHSALAPQFKRFENDLVLLVGNGDIEVVAKYCGSKKYITVTEYICAFPELCPFSGYSIEFRQETIQNLKLRLNLTDEDLKEPFQCHAIFILTMCFNWEENIQIILDLLSTEDGKVAESMPAVGPSKHIPVFVAYNDVTYKSDFQLPRIVNGCFTTSLKNIYKTIYKTDIQLEFYGKPQLKQFEFARDFANQNIDSNHEVTNFYMIGDNPQSDIKGANEIGWTSILVRTGVFQGGDNDETDPATHVVQDFFEAIKLIFKLEGISTQLLDDYMN